MIAISMWQPWGSLWLSPRKVHETRGYWTRKRGWLLVHAAKRKIDGPIPEDELDAICVAEFGLDFREKLPLGAVIGAVKLIACKPTDDMEWTGDPPADYWCGDFSPRRFAWERGEFKKFDVPIPFKGKQGFFTVPEELLPDDFRSAKFSRPLP